MNMFKCFFRKNKLKENILILIERSKILGLDKKFIIDALEYYQCNEFQLSFDTIVENLYEYNIHIDKITLDLINNLIDLMKLSKEDYKFCLDNK